MVRHVHQADMIVLPMLHDVDDQILMIIYFSIIVLHQCMNILETLSSSRIEESIISQIIRIGNKTFFITTWNFRWDVLIAIIFSKSSRMNLLVMLARLVNLLLRDGFSNECVIIQQCSNIYKVRKEFLSKKKKSHPTNH